MAKNGMKVMDSDIHVMEPEDLWDRYVEKEFRDQRPLWGPVQTEWGELEAWRFAGRAFPAYMDDPRRQRFSKVRTDKATQRHVADGRYAKVEDDLQGDNPKSMLKAMDIEGVDVSIVFRTLASHFIAVDGLDPKLSAALCRAFNNWLGEFCAQDTQRLKPTAILPLQDIEESIKEARRAVNELGAIALVLPNHPVNEMPWYDACFDPLWGEAEKLGVPIAFHGIQNAYQEHLGKRYIDNFAMAHACGHPVEQMLSLGCLLTGGVFERFTGLRAAFLEGSCGWVPWWLWVLDERVEKFTDRSQFPLQRPPSETFRKHCWVAMEPDEAGVAKTIAAGGDSNIVISTDWPHDDSAYPHAISSFLALDALSNDSKRKILWDNCASLYGL